MDTAAPFEDPPRAIVEETDPLTNWKKRHLQVEKDAVVCSRANR